MNNGEEREGNECDKAVGSVGLGPGGGGDIGDGVGDADQRVLKQGREAGVVDLLEEEDWRCSYTRR